MFSTPETSVHVRYPKITPRRLSSKQGWDNNKQIHLVEERFTLEILQNTTDYSYTVDVSVSDRDENINTVIIIASV